MTAQQFQKLQRFLPRILAFTILVYGISFTQTHYTFTSNTGNNMTVALQTATNATINGVPIANGDEVGAFTPAGLCVGAIEWQGLNTAVTVWGNNDQTQEIDGIASGDTIFYRVWDASASTEYTATVTYSLGGPTYSVDGLAVLSSLTAVTTPTLTLTAPNGSEQWQEGTQQNITWNYTGDITNVQLEYSTNGTDFTEIVASVSAASNTYSWTVPSAVSNTVTVRINQVSGSATDVSDADFEITAAPIPKTLTLTAPNGGEQWQAGTQQNITWNYTGDITNVQLEYSTNGTDYTEIVASVSASTNTYSWTVPSAVSSSATIRINEVGGSATDVSDANFEITAAPIPKTLTLTSPNGGETWETSSIQDITWSVTGDVTNVQLEYSTNGIIFTEIASSVLAFANSYSWTVPNVPSSTVKIRINEEGGSATDISDGDFEIASPSNINQSGSPQFTFSMENKGILFQSKYKGVERINIFNLDGQLISTFDSSFNELTIQENELDKGVYLLQLKHNTGIETGKIAVW